MQLEIDAVKEAAAWPGADRRTPVVLASQLMAAELCQESHPPARLYAGRGPGQRKGNAMHTRVHTQTLRSRRSPCPGSSLTEPMSEVQRAHSWVPPTTVAPAC